MPNGEWQVSLRDNDFGMQINMFVYRETAYGIEYCHIEDGHFILTEGKRMEPVKPFLTISGMMARDLFKGLATALDEKGFKPDSNAKIEGTLNATKYHLEDLRTMLKLTKQGA